jgi:hypothetical protein
MKTALKERLCVMTAQADGCNAKAQSTAGQISAARLQLWEALARNEDCISMFTSDDIRLMLAEIKRLDHAVYYIQHDPISADRFTQMSMDGLKCDKNIIPQT